MNISGNVPVQVQITDPPPLQQTLDWQGGNQGQSARRRGWVIPALIAALTIVLVAALLWPREHAVPTAPAPTTTMAPAPSPAPANGYSEAERQADEAQAKALAKIEELKRM